MTSTKDERDTQETSSTGWEPLFLTLKEDIDDCLTKIVNRCVEKNIYLIPSPQDIFRAYRLCRFNTLRVVMLAQEPYSKPDSEGYSLCNGLAFSTDGNRMTPSLEVLRSWLLCSYKEYEGRTMDTSLLPWVRQGVLLINASLTVEYTKDEMVRKVSHRKAWESFIRSTLRYCAEKGNVVFILLGKVAHEYSDSLPPSAKIVRAEHPAYFSRKGIKSTKDPCFRIANDHLLELGQGPIVWTRIFS